MKTKQMATILFLTMNAVLFTGCVSHPNHPRNYVNITSINDGNTYSNCTYRLLSGTDKISENDLQFREYAKYLIPVLAQKGYVPAPIGQLPDIAILLNYGTSGPIEDTQQYSVPTYGQTGVSSSYTTGTISTYGNTAMYSGNTIHTPTYGVTGYRQGTRTITTYGCYIFINAKSIDKDYAESEKSTEIWRTRITCYGKEGDLRMLFPRLIYCAKDYIGEDTGETIETTVRTDEYYTLPDITADP